jgi:soluble lytic murein transglycosylase-like protein
MPTGSTREYLFPAVCAVALTAALGLATAAPVLAQPIETVGKLCAAPIARFERSERIPRQLLAAVALAESGRWDKARGAKFAWPWTVTAGGKGRFFDTKAAAIAEVRRLRASGISNIDVGCMQINLKYHPDAFDDLNQAFDPSENVAYAARFLKRLNEARRSWSMAVGLYHSSNREFLYP